MTEPIISILQYLHKLQPWSSWYGLISTLSKRMTINNVTVQVTSLNKQGWIPTDTLITSSLVRRGTEFCSPHWVFVPREFHDYVTPFWVSLLNLSSPHMTPFGFILEGAAQEPDSLWPFIYSPDLLIVV